MEKSKNSAHLPVFVYAPEYDLEIGPHVFPAIKFGILRNRLRADERFQDHLFARPEPLTVKEARTVHGSRYLEALVNLRPTPALRRSELPLTRQIVDGFFLASGGTLLAARLALENGRAMNLSGGFHHAFAREAQGFCYLNDVAIAVRILQKEKKIRRALIVDLDVHQGNGTARIFRRDRNVFTFSMHEMNNYPRKEKSSLDVGLATGCEDREYLSLLRDALRTIRARFTPDMIFYLAGVDIFEKDRLGGLALSRQGMLERDRVVRDFMPGVPLVTVLAGGDSINTDDTISLHLQTCEVLAGLDGAETTAHAG